MLPEWLCNARLPVSRSRCATPDAPRLLTDATEAFIDRTPIDWAALLSRLRAAPDRALVENLRAIDAVRRAFRSDGVSGAATAHRRTLVTIVIALAAVQALVSLLLLASALAGGAHIGHRAPQLALAFAFGAACAVLFRTASDDARRLWLLGTFMCAAAAFARGALSGVPDAWSSPAAVVVRALAVEAFTPACLWQFALDFPRVRRFVRFDLLARRAAVAAWGLGLASFLVNVAAALHILPDGAGGGIVPQHGSTVFWGLFSLLCAPAIGAILVRSRRAPRVERRRVARFALALGAGVSPLLGLGVARTLFPDVDSWLRSSGSSTRLWLDGVVLGSLAATPILSVLAVIVDRPFEPVPAVRSMRRRRLPAISLTVTVVAGVALMGSVSRTTAAALVPESFLWFVAGSAAAGAIAFALRVSIVGTVHSPGVRSVDLQTRLAAALDRLRTARGAREIAAVLHQEFRRGLGASTVRILSAGRAGVFQDVTDTAVRLLPEAGLKTVLRDSRQPLDLSAAGAMLPLLSRTDREWVLTAGADLALPVKRADGTVAAIVLLGRTPAGTAFDRRERWFAAALCNAAAAAWNQCPPDPRGIGRDDDPAFECRRCGRISGAAPPRCCGKDQATVSALPRRVAGKFLVHRRIGSGGMGVVYLARDLSLGRYVALKTLPATSADGMKRLRTEARAMARSSHESLATIYGFEVWRRTPVLVLEYFPAGTLAARLAAGPLPLADVVRLGMDLTRGAAVLHRRGFLHRDLKPSNIALAETGAAKILDFGLIALIEGSPRSHRDGPAVADVINNVRAGTLPYLPPEAFGYGRVSHHFDLWSLAVVLLEAAIGVNPFAARTRAATVARILDYDRNEMRSRVRSAAPALGPFFERALAYAPQERFHTAAEMLGALRTIKLTGDA